MPYVKIGAIVLFLGAFGLLLYFFPPSEIVAAIGVENAYLVGFLAALTAGFSSLTGTATFAAIASLAQGGATPWLLGLCAGVGLFLSDSGFYFILTKGRESVTGKAKKLADTLEEYIERVPVWAVMLVIVIYTALSPLPNDILLLALAASGYRYLVFAPALLVGDLIIMQIVTQIGAV